MTNATEHHILVRYQCRCCGTAMRVPARCEGCGGVQFRPVEANLLAREQEEAAAEKRREKEAEARKAARLAEQNIAAPFPKVPFDPGPKPSPKDTKPRDSISRADLILLGIPFPVKGKG